MRNKKILASTLLLFTLTLSAGCSGVSQEDYDSKIKELSNLQEKYDTLVSQNNELSNKVTEYEKIIEPYKELSAAEVSAQTKKANLEAKEAEKELQAIEAAEKKAAEEKAAKEKAAKEAKEKQGYNTGITYDQLARTPDKYKNEKVKFSGKVIQVVEDESMITLRMAINSDYDKVILLAYNPDIVSSRVLKDDNITIYGVSDGVYTYESTLGGNITIPLVIVDKIDQ